MTLWVVSALLFVVSLMVAGQLFFKATALVLQQEGTWQSAKVLFYFVPSLAIYGLATLAWIWVLQYVELSRAYPFMALAFVLVPIFSAWFFGEHQGWRYYIGVSLICIGVMLTATSSSPAQ